LKNLFGAAIAPAIKKRAQHTAFTLCHAEGWQAGFQGGGERSTSDKLSDQGVNPKNSPRVRVFHLLINPSSISHHYAQHSFNS
jgi:hypothetical protein